MKHTSQPGIFLLVKIVLLMNIVSGAFLFVILSGATLFDSFSSSFEKTEVILDVRKSARDTAQLEIDSSLGYGFKQSRSGDLAVRMPWYTQFFVPFGFFNIPVFELSIPYWLFYCCLAFCFIALLPQLK